MPKLNFFIFISLFCCLLGMGQITLAATEYHPGENLNCTGTNEQISLDVVAAAITRNGVVYHEIPTQSFAFWYFSAYDQTKMTDQGWNLEVFSVSDSNGAGKSYLIIDTTNATGGDGQQIPVDCAKAN